ncbi:hypothetical protein F0562_032186 [Nyssa sinensis]|uniref:Uncharacterized protein n=1 Tax=Nyssa sinensis TaxID=561372 RepID=A0A5J5AW60_9ASTE|nr:hypothetical protein F0562_032186 [Nyssa sinensis]
MGLGLATAEETIVDVVASDVIDRTVVEIIGREDRDFVRSRGWDLYGRMVENRGGLGAGLCSGIDRRFAPVTSRDLRVGMRKFSRDKFYVALMMRIWNPTHCVGYMEC